MIKGEIVDLLNEATFYIEPGMNMDIQAFLKGEDHIDQYMMHYKNMQEEIQIYGAK